MVAVIDVHRYGDTLGVHGVDEVHIGIEGKVMVAYSYLPIDLFPGLDFVFTALADSKDRVVVINDLLTPRSRRVEFEEFEWLGALVATDVIDHTELLGMVYTIDRSCTSSHRETGDGSSTLIGACAVVLFDVGDQLLEDVVFVFPVGSTEGCRIGSGRIEVHHVLLVAFGAYDNHVINGPATDEAVSHLREVIQFFPIGMAASTAVHQVENRVLAERFFVVTARQVDSVVALGDAVEQVAWHLLHLSATWALWVGALCCDHRGHQHHAHNGKQVFHSWWFLIIDYSDYIYNSDYKAFRD